MTTPREIDERAAWDYLVANDLDYLKYKDKRGNRRAYESLMNYEITDIANDVFLAGSTHGRAAERKRILGLLRSEEAYKNWDGHEARLRVCTLMNECADWLQSKLTEEDKG